MALTLSFSHQNKSEIFDELSIIVLIMINYLGVDLLVDALHEGVPQSALLGLLVLVLHPRLDALKPTAGHPGTADYVYFSSK